MYQRWRQVRKAGHCLECRELEGRTSWHRLIQSAEIVSGKEDASSRGKSVGHLLDPNPEWLRQ